MSTSNREIKAVPTNIITGFLGVGKTSAILHLLKNKPKRERWAVLVNEFGEVGVDGSLFQGQQAQEQGVFIREVPGGCMCCASGLPMQIALNLLLARAKPDRLLIEPSGLGHPVEVLQVLSAEHYREILSLQKIITLVDARKLKDERYTKHETFNQQIAIADIVVGNKQDLYLTEDKERLTHYIQQFAGKAAPTVFTEQGCIELELLQGATLSIVEGKQHHHATMKSVVSLSDTPIPECGYLKARNKGEGYESVGWRFSSELTFNRVKLFSLLSGITAERMKAVFMTDEGAFGYNFTTDALTEIALDDCLESRIETIGKDLSENLEAELISCILNYDRGTAIS